MVSTHPLQINIDQVLEEGLELHETIGTELLSEVLADEDSEIGFHVTAPSRLDAKLSKVSGGVLVEGKMDLHAGASCKRCLTETRQTFPVEFTLNLIPRNARKFGDDEDGEGEDRGKGERGGSFDLEDADEELFDGKTIDLDPIVREQVLLALPMDVVCKDDCKGLCPMCGQNLNEKQCGCESKFVDPRFAALKDIKLS